MNIGVLSSMAVCEISAGGAIVLLVIAAAGRVLLSYYQDRDACRHFNHAVRLHNEAHDWDKISLGSVEHCEAALGTLVEQSLLTECEARHIQLRAEQLIVFEGQLMRSKEFLSEQKLRGESIAAAKQYVLMDRILLPESQRVWPETPREDTALHEANSCLRYTLRISIILLFLLNVVMATELFRFCHTTSDWPHTLRVVVAIGCFALVSSFLYWAVQLWRQSGQI